jgi:DNA mismatch endonuclease (patch repair protein)
MADRISAERRSAIMAKVRGKDSKPEMAVRKALHAAGFRYRLHRRDLPGTPDIAISSIRSAVFVHGCFWHGHDCAKGRNRPSSNAAFWIEKLDRNLVRDQLAHGALLALGWHVETVWECDLKLSIGALIDRLNARRPSPAD